MIPKRRYYRIYLGKGGVYSQEAIEKGFIGAGWEEKTNMTALLSGDWQYFHDKFIPIYQNSHGKNTSKIAAGSACGMLYTICKGIQKGDIVLSPDGNGPYFVGEVTSDYRYVLDGPLPHRRDVKWYPITIAKDKISKELSNSMGSISTVCNITKYAEEIEKLLENNSASDGAIPSDVVDPAAFEMENHLEAFIVRNWSQIRPLDEYEIYQGNEVSGRQYNCMEAGIIDILAISKDETKFLVIELKRGRASDAAVGQILRYMGYVKEFVADSNQTVHGIIIALEDDRKMQWALSAVNNIEFYRYEIAFNLIKT